MSRAAHSRWPRAVIVALAVAVAAPAEAGFEEGKQAAMSGNYETAYKEWRPLAEHGHVEAQFLLGLMYREGRGVSQDLVASASWLAKAAEQGHVDAEYYLARAYRLGQGVDRDAKAALRWFHRAAEQNHADAAYTIALMTRRGEGVAADDSVATEWYRIAARLGHGEARFTLGAAYEEGRGVVTDPVRAYAWYSLAGKSGVELGTVLRDRLRRRLSTSQVAEAEALMEKLTAPPSALPALGEQAAKAEAEPAAPSPQAAGGAEAEEPVAQVATAPTVDAPNPMAAKSTAGGHFYVRLASYRFADEPLRGWQLLKRANGDLLEPLSPVVKEVDLGAGKGTYYRLYAGPLADRKAAKELCAALKSREAECLVDQP